MKKILLTIIIFIGSFTVGYSQCMPSVSLKADKSNVCIGEQITFTATSVNGGIPTYVWSSSVYGVLPETTDTYIFTSKIQYEVISVKMTSSLGCASPSSVTEYINVSYYFNAGLIGTYQTICYNTIPSPITETSTNTATTPIYSWEVSQTGTEGSFTLLPDETSPTYTPTRALTQDMYIRRLLVDQSAQAPCNSGYSNIVKITVKPVLGGGTITADQTICSNTLPQWLFESTPSNAGFGKYSWEMSEDNITYRIMEVNSNTTNYTSFYYPYTSDTYIRRITTDITSPASCNSAASNSVKITIMPTIIPGSIVGDETICSGGNIATSTMSQATAPTGRNGTYSYQWQSDEVGHFQNIAGATNSTYNAGYLLKTTSFRILYGPCGNATSNIITKSVTSLEISVDANHTGQVCSGTEMIFTVTPINGGAAPSYQWYIGTIPVGSNTATYNFISKVTDYGKQITVKVTSSDACTIGTATSRPVFLNIVPSITPTIITDNNSMCEGYMTKIIITSIYAGFTPAYQWYVIPQESGSALAVGGGTMYISTVLQDGDKVYVEQISNAECFNPNTNPSRSNIITMNIRPIPNPTINEGDQTICTGESFTFTSTSTSIIPQTTWQWFKENTNSNIAIPGATNSFYTATEAGIYWLLQDNYACSVPSIPVTLTIDPCGGFSSTITGPNPIIPGQQNAVYRVANQTGFTYTWSITGGTIVSGQNTNRVIVDWDAPTSNALARTTSTSYSISVVEKNQSNQTKTTTATINTITTAVTQSQAQSGINVFPNPTTGTFNIEMPESGVAVSYVILDLTGLTVASGIFTSTGSDQTIDSDLDAGMYQIVLKYNNTVTCVRLSKVL